MKHRKKLLTASIVACLAMSAAAHAQAVYQPATPDTQNAATAPQPPLLAAADAQATGGGSAAQGDQELGTIEVIGIREVRSFETKAVAEAAIEIVEPGQLQRRIIIIVEIVDPDERLAAIEQHARYGCADEAGRARDQNSHKRAIRAAAPC